MVAPLFVGRPSSLEAIQAAQTRHETIICATQIDPEEEKPSPEQIYKVGVEVALGRTMQLPDGLTSVLAQGRRRIEIVEYMPSGGEYLRVKVRPIGQPSEPSQEIEARRRAVLDLYQQCVELDHSLPEDAYVFAMNIDDPGWLSDMIATSININTQTRQELLEMSDPAERLLRISILLGKELEVLKLEDQIRLRVQEEVDKTQREMFLREQMRAIQTELGESDIFQQEIDEIREQIEKVEMPDAIKAKARKEVSRLSGMPAMAPEVGVIRTYLDWLLELPWCNKTEDNLDMRHVSEVLEAHHYGLEKAKERILEHIAVLKLAPDKMRSPVLCFVGPPGTGKTSLGKSIAEALGREFARVSLGGVRDEAEIRGHRRTYIGAMPGRIIQTMRRMGTVSPLFMLDEIDKLGADYRGDPSAALLEVLDPEQNNAFSDHYLEVDYDLSQVMFIATANYTDPIPPALKDRLEIIEFPGYIEEEKVHIAQKFLIPRELEKHGIKNRGIHFDEKTIYEIIGQYTYEAGVRNLEREIANICRKIARRVAEDRPHPKRITAASLVKYLGPPQIPEPLLNEQDEIGMALGLAWTEVGGDISPVEVNLMPGKGNLTLTGQLGEIMRESAQAALSYTRSIAEEYNLEDELFEDTDIHIHLPEGAIPKDGPSAGVTMATALVSAFTEQPVRCDIAMTGEVTLRGKVLPVGGIKEKVMAAHRVGISNVIIPAKNKQDLVDVPRRAQSKLNIIFVKDMEEVLAAALLPAEDDDEPAENEPEGEDSTTV